MRCTRRCVPRSLGRLALVGTVVAAAQVPGGTAAGQAARPTAPVEVGPPLRMAMSGAFQPFSTTDAEGRLVGFDADVAREIARRLGRPAELVQTDWAGIQAGLQQDKYELIVGSMAITEERLARMSFSLPYYVSGAQVFARRGATGGADPGLSGQRVGVTEDSTYATYIAEHPETFADVEVIRYGSEAEIVAAMNTDKIDAFVSDRIVGGFYVQRGSTIPIEPVGELLYREACGIAARQDEPELVREVNGALFDMVQEGTYAAIYERWVGAPPELELLFSAWEEHVDTLPPPTDAAVAERDADSTPSFAERATAMLPLLGRGALLTLALSLLTAFLALLTGTLIGVGATARSRFVSRACTGYVWAVRGTPLLVQLFIAYFAVATAINQLVGFELVGAFGAALLALVINTTAYNAETLRGGIMAVARGQWDAAASLGMTRGQTVRRIVLPQAFRSSLPSLGNNLVVLVKDTSLVGAITLIELTYAARNVVFQTGQALLPFLLAAAFYLAMISLVSFGVYAVEKRLSRSRIESAA